MAGRSIQSRAHRASQKKYGYEFWQASRDIGQQIANGYVHTFGTLWLKARNWRIHAAGNNEETNEEIFGAARCMSMRPTVTPLENHYEYIKDRYSQRTDGILQTTPLEIPVQVFPLKEELHGEPIVLSSVIMSTNPEATRNQANHPRFTHMSDMEFTWPCYIEHCTPYNITLIMEHVNKLYNNALDPRLSDTKFIENLANIHWWTANAVEDKRGSAAKAELCVRAIAQARGMDLPPFKHGVIADLEAMTTPRKDFVSQYSNFFDG